MDAERACSQSFGEPSKFKQIWNTGEHLLGLLPPVKIWRKTSEERQKKFKFVMGLFMSACLNVADFVSDWYVVLQYGCVIPSALNTSCNLESGRSCESHPWWFAFGVFMLIGSNLVQSVGWAGMAVAGGDGFLLEHHYIHQIDTWSRWLLAVVICFTLAFCQLHYVVELILAFHLGDPMTGGGSGDFGGIRGRALIFRELATQILESGPQLYFQSYVVFAAGSSGDLVTILSVGISIMALSHGILNFWLLFPTRKDALKKLSYRVVSFLWLSSDQAVRAAGCALALSTHIRPYGPALVGLAAVMTMGVIVWTRAKDYGTKDQLLLHALFLATYLLPAVIWIDRGDPRDGLAVERALLVRWVEMAGVALLSYLLAKTNCGHTPVHESLGLFGLVIFNFVCYQAMQYVEIGKFQPCGCLQREGVREELELKKNVGQDGSEDAAYLSLDSERQRAEAEKYSGNTGPTSVQSEARRMDPSGDSPRRQKVTKKAKRRKPKSTEVEVTRTEIEGGAVDEGDASAEDKISFDFTDTEKRQPTEVHEAEAARPDTPNPKAKESTNGMRKGNGQKGAAARSTYLDATIIGHREEGDEVAAGDGRAD